ncbi:MAG: D-sedoheptulose 7-phosphate isomerase [Proteobacteria bacterium]|jgi:D-sedoheptulose 7-phosphate isomerase|nr:D-sedoheptulose 7-phosphate isomerase [Desulfocapsa sp.]MBU3945651.1 D-sedoheptulose 7-phosphate isomerase [Pseudomonadota bacterium]MCG2743638.1 D-sedoheptulose 7-phosphate isomerase [Desulfobacteraceae bacterium]MBU3982233.1 D-sedoheptulose 7-phosphate isomerase [Pseudomonadota bacterium]MBU4030257.1 D-sedoheptulose 7-phosphate isomerase [Pseudomonadota bacterium]
MQQVILTSLKNSILAQESFAQTQGEVIIALVQQMVMTIRRGGKILLFGNGGSAADAQHMAAEFVNRFLINRRPMAALALTTDSSVLTSIANDFSFDEIFVKQVQALGKPEDLALGISTSGGSVNVLKAMEVAREIGMVTAALTGGLAGDGGAVGRAADFVLNVPSDKTPHIQETHLWVEHLLCELVEKEIFGDDARKDA